MGLVHHTNIVTDGLIFCADPANKRCYSGSGDTCRDLAGGVTGDFVNDTSLSSDWNGVFDFDGTDDYIDFGSPAALQNQVGTVIGWGRWDETNTDQGGLVSYLYAHGSLAHGWNLLNHGTYQIGRSLAGSHYDYWTGSSSYKFDKDEWVMASFSFAGNSNPVITYRNDVAINTDSSQGTTVTYTGAKVLIGRTDVSAYREWRGQIGPVYIYNRVLTQDEITQMYKALKPRFEPRIPKEGLTGYWDAGDPASYNGGQTWTDTANGFVGPFYNGAGEAISFDPANGGSLVFDGTDDRIGPIMLPGDYSGTARSIILWVSPDTHEQEMIAFNSADDKFKATVGQSASYGTYIFRADVGGNSPQVGSFADSLITVEDWACIGMTINASDEIVSMYLNGVSKTGGANGWNFQDDTYIGRSSSGAPWNGKIATVRLYTKTLSAGEVIDNYNKTKARFGH